MITKDELFEIPRMEAEIKKKEERKKRLQEKATSPPSIKTSEKVQASKKGDSMTDIADLVVDLANEIRKDKRELKKSRKKAETLFDKVDGLNREILVLRYGRGESWDAIGQTVGYSERHVRRIHYNIIRTIYG